MKKLFVAALLLMLPFTASAHFLTDTWWVPTEPGSAVSVVHEGNVLNVALYTHDAQRQARWYSAALTRYGNNATGDPEFRGELYLTSGSNGTGPWRPEDLSHRRVGEIFFMAAPDGSAGLVYLIDGTQVAKRIERYAFHQDRFEGLHFATLLPGYDTCPQGFQGLNVFERGTLYIERCEGANCLTERPLSGEERAPVHMVLSDGQRNICRVDGRYTQYGRSGGIRGTYECDDGGRGDITFKNIEFSSVGFAARFTATHPACAEFRGILTGARATAR